MLTRSRIRLLLAACAASAALVAVLPTTATATATPVGVLPAGTTSMIHTQPGQLVAVALPHRADGKVWRVATRINLTRRVTAKAFESRQFVVMIMPGG